MTDATPATKLELQVVSLRAIARHALAELHRAESEGVRLDCESLSIRLGIRHSDARAVLTNLHREGLYDVMRRSLTLAGIAHGLRFAEQELPAPRRAEAARASRAEAAPRGQPPVALALDELPPQSTASAA